MRQRAAQMKASITEAHKRVAAHAKIRIVSKHQLLRGTNMQPHNYKQYGNSDSGSGPPQAENLRFYGSSMKISLDFDAIWHLEY